MNYYVEATLKKENIEIWLSTGYKEQLNSNVEILVNGENEINFGDLLKTLNFTKEEISILNSVNKTRTFAETSILYNINDEGLELYKLALKKLDKLIKKENTEPLTQLEKALIEIGQNDIDNVEDVLLPYVEVKEVAESNPRGNLINFINIIKNHIDIVKNVYISGNFYIGYDTFVSYSSFYDGYYILNIEKEKEFDSFVYLNDTRSHKISLNAVPLEELGVSGIKEDLFTKGLNSKLINELNSMKEERKVFWLNNEILRNQNELKAKAKKEILKGNPNPLTNKELKIVNLLNYIKTFEDKEIKNYYLYRKETVYNINDNWLKKANNVKSKKITFIDLIYFIEKIAKM